MAKDTKKDTVETGAANIGETESRFSKEQILTSATFANRRDLLTVLLEDGKEYTVAEVEKVISDWMKKGVK